MPRPVCGQSIAEIVSVTRTPSAPRRSAFAPELVCYTHAKISRNSDDNAVAIETGHLDFPGCLVDSLKPGSDLDHITCINPHGEKLTLTILVYSAAIEAVAMIFGPALHGGMCDGTPAHWYLKDEQWGDRF